MSDPAPSRHTGLVLLDANVFLALAFTEPEDGRCAVDVLREYHGRIAVSELIVLETESVIWRKRRPGLSANGRRAMVHDARSIFDQIGVLAPVDSQVIRSARHLCGLEIGLSAMDAIHAATALHLGAELVTFERPTKPFFQVPGLKCRSLHAAAAPRES